MAKPHDFTAELGAQLRDAGQKMKAMRKTKRGDDDAPLPDVLDPLLQDTSPLSPITDRVGPNEKMTVITTDAPADSLVATQSINEIVSEYANETVPETVMRTPVTDDNGAPAPSINKAVLPAVTVTPQEEKPLDSTRSPALSEKAWTGGVRGLVLNAMRDLAEGEPYVLVNLKRLAAHMRISYGSVRNAVCRLTHSGDIRTRQVRVADGHGVRVDFLTSPGAEGTALVVRVGRPRLNALTTPAVSGENPDPPPRPTTPKLAAPVKLETPHVTRRTSANFWDTTDTVFSLAWPYVAAAGLNMAHLRKLLPVFTVQGFNSALLPRCLRSLDELLERHPDDTTTLVEDFMHSLQRRGTWSIPEEYDTEDA